MEAPTAEVPVQTPAPQAALKSDSGGATVVARPARATTTTEPSRLTKRTSRVGVEPESEAHAVQTLFSEQLTDFMGDAPTCSTCGQFTIRSGSCYRCLFCGESEGCS